VLVAIPAHAEPLERCLLEGCHVHEMTSVQVPVAPLSIGHVAPDSWTRVMADLIAGAMDLTRNPGRFNS